MIDGNIDSYWMSELNKEEVYVNINFETVQIFQIRIVWKYPPLAFEIKIK